MACAGRLPLPAPVQPLVVSEDAAFRKQAPTLPPVDADPPSVPEFQTATLANGLEVWVIARPGAPSVSMSVVTRGAGRLGAASACSAERLELTARAMIEGGMVWVNGHQVDPPQINGHGVSYAVRYSGTRFEMQVLRSSLEGGLLVLARTLQFPAFAPGQLQPIWLGVLKSLQSESGSRDNLLLRLAAAGTFGEEVAKRLVPARLDEVRDADRAAVERCYRETFTPEHSALLVVGDVTLAETRELAQSLFGGWRRAVKPLQVKALAVEDAEERVVHWLVSGEQPQASVLLMQRGPTTDAVADELPFALLSYIAVGQSRSRANITLRHDFGFTYGLRPSLISAPSLGMLMVKAEFETRQTGFAIRELLNTLQQLKDKPVSAAELDDAKHLFISDFPDVTSSNDTLLSAAESLFVYGRAPNWWRGARERLQSMNAQDLLHVARKYLRPSRAAISVYGSASLAHDLDRIGHVELYHYELQ